MAQGTLFVFVFLCLGSDVKKFQVYFIHINFFKKPNKKNYNRIKKLYCNATIFVLWFFIVYLPKKNKKYGPRLPTLPSGAKNTFFLFHKKNLLFLNNYGAKKFELFVRRLEFIARKKNFFDKFLALFLPKLYIFSIFFVFILAFKSLLVYWRKSTFIFSWIEKWTRLFFLIRKIILHLSTNIENNFSNNSLKAVPQNGEEWWMHEEQIFEK